MAASTSEKTKRLPPEFVEFRINPEIWVPAKVEIKGAKKSRNHKEVVPLTEQITAFVDCGATINCIDPSLVAKLNIPWKSWGKGSLVGVNTTIQRSIQYVALYLTFEGKGAWHPFRVLECPRSKLLLGMPWLQRMDTTVEFRNRTIKQGNKAADETLDQKVDTTSISKLRQHLAKHKRQIRQITKRKPMSEAKLRQEITSRLYLIRTKVSEAYKKGDFKEVKRLKERAVNYEAPYVIAIWPKAADQDTEEAIEKFRKTPYYSILREYMDVFTENQPEVPVRAQEHQMNIVTDEQKERECWARPIRLSPDKAEAMEKWVQEGLKTGIIEHSKSHMCSPVFLVPKPNGKWRVVVDLRRVNAISKPMRNPVPRKDDILDRFRNRVFLTRADLIGAFWQVPLTKEARAKCAFVTPSGLYQFCVLPMGHKNSPAFFNDFVSRKFSGLEAFASVYFDDVFVYSYTLEEHKQHLRKVFQILREHKLYLKPSKLILGQPEIPALGDIVSGTQTRPDPAKTEGIRNYAAPKTKKQMRSFLGMTSYLRRYIPRYSHIAAPLSTLMAQTTDRSPIKWTNETKASFDQIKQILANPRTLALANEDYYKILETDASDYAVGWVLKQNPHSPGVGSRSGGGDTPTATEYDSKQDEVVAYGGAKLNKHERNLNTREKEFLGVLTGLRANKVYLHKPFLIRTDHRSLTTVKDQKTISQKIARWYGELATYDFRIEYLPGPDNTIADAMSRQPQDDTIDTREEIRENLTKMFTDTVYQLHPLLAEATKGKNTLTELIRRSQDRSTETQQVKQAVLGGKGCEGYAVKNRILYDTKTEPPLIVIPNSAKLYKRLLKEYHNDVYGGHYGTEKTIMKMSRFIKVTPDLRKWLKKEIGKCRTCQITRGNRIAQQIRGSKTPDKPWQVIAADFIDGLPKDTMEMTEMRVTYDRILVLACLLTRKAIFVPSHSKWTAEDVTRQLYLQIIRHNGIPQEFRADNDKLWREGTATYEALGALGVKVRQMSAYSSKSNGGVERIHQSIHRFMRAYLKDKTKWVEALPLAEMTYNTTPHSSLGGVTPFEAERGYRMNMVTSILPAHTKRPKLDEYLDSRMDELKRLKQISDAKKEKYVKDAQRDQKPFKTTLGSWVLLSTDKFSKDQLNLPLAVTRKWGAKWAGPFQIIEVISEGRTVRLNLGNSRKHNIISTDDLKPYLGDRPKTGSGPSIGDPSSVNISAAATPSEDVTKAESS